MIVLVILLVFFYYLLLFTFNVVIIAVGVNFVVDYIFSRRVCICIIYTSDRHVFTVIVYFSRLSGIHCYYLHVQYTRIIVVVLYGGFKKSSNVQVDYQILLHIYRHIFIILI